jgi:peptide/nickel transport system permease protein
VSTVTTPDVRDVGVVAAEMPGLLRRLLKKAVAVVCLAYLGFFVAVAIIAPIALPSVAHQQAGDLFAARQGPSWGHVLGTDTVGRDVLDRLLVGTRPTLIAVIEALVVTLGVGVPIGLAAGYIGGRVDRAVGWWTDLSFSLPGIAIVLLVLSVFPHNTLAAMVTVGLLGAPGIARVVRSATLPIREEQYIAAARVSGLSRPTIIRSHIFPRILGPIIILAALTAAGALLAQGGLAYLGLLAPVPAPSWGGMIGDGISNIVLQPWLIWPPGVAMTVTTMAFVLLGDAVRDTTAETWSAPIQKKRQLSVVAEQPGDMRGSDALLCVRGLTVSLPANDGQVNVVEDVSFEIAAGETVGLVGESGCGKTMTAMSLLGLLPGGGEITSGRIVFGGQDLTAMSDRRLQQVRGRSIGLISQQPTSSLNPAFRVGWQLSLSLRKHRKLSSSAASREALELLKQVRLPEPDVVACRYPHELSGGMAQRVAIARALAGDPELLIGDEPTTALDVSIQAEILELLRDLQRERNMAILLVTHDWGVVADMCDRVAVMYAGEIVEYANVRDIFFEPRHPYTQALLRSNPHDQRNAQRLLAIPGSVPTPGAWPEGCRFHPRCGYATPGCAEHPIKLEPVEGNDTRASRCIHQDQLSRVSSNATAR